MSNVINGRTLSPSTWFIIIGWTIWFFVGFLADLDLFTFGYLSSMILMLTVFGLIFSVKVKKVNPINKQSSLLSIWFPSIGWITWVFTGVLRYHPDLFGVDFYRSFIFSSSVVFVLMTLGLIFGVKARKSGAGLPGLILSVLGLIYLIFVISAYFIIGSLGSGFN